MTTLQTTKVNLSKISVEEAMAHYGIKGMKWGVRRPIGSDGLIKKTSNAAKVVGDRAKDVKAKREAAKPKSLVKTAKEMDLDELKDRVARLELEKRYVNLNQDLNNLQKSKLQKMLQKSFDQNTQKIANDPAVANAISEAMQAGIKQVIRK